MKISTTAPAESASPAVSRRVSHQHLQELRDQHRGSEQNHAQHEHHEHSRGEIPLPQQLDIDDRIAVPPLIAPRTRSSVTAEITRQRQDHARSEPVVLLALVEHDLQAADADA